MATKSSYRSPPKFDGNFTQFEKEVSLWKDCCGIKAEEQGGILALSLTGTPRTLATNIPHANIVCAQGLNNVMEELKKLYATDSIDNKFKVLTELETYCRSDESVMDYIAEFERKFTAATDFLGAEAYADFMKAFKLIRGANLSDTDSRIVRGSLVDWQYLEAVKALKKIFGSSSSPSSMSSSPDLVKVKTEAVNFAKHGDREGNRPTSNFKKKGR